MLYPSSSPCQFCAVLIVRSLQPAVDVIADARCHHLGELVRQLAPEVGAPAALERWHDLMSPKLVRPLADRLATLLSRAGQELFTALALDVGRAAFGDLPLVCQVVPYVRVLPPRRPDLAVPFHSDAWAGNPSPQRTIWVPLVDVGGAESLWLAPHDGPVDPAARLDSLAARWVPKARPVTLCRGEALVFGEDVGHGAVAHDADVTRVSVDWRVAPVTAKGRAPWYGRALVG
jgi:hypothetical protein